MDKIVIEKSGQHCTVDDNNYNQQPDERTFSSSFQNLVHGDDRWQTSMRDAFSIPGIGKIQTIGRRRDLIRSIINQRVLEKLKTPEEVLDDGFDPSEYSDNFCDPKFTPFMDKLDIDESKLTKYPLYSCNNHTFYKDLVERGALKLRSEIYNLNEPFRKNCTFTTSPDHALREPTGGY